MILCSLLIWDFHDFLKGFNTLEAFVSRFRPPPMPREPWNCCSVSLGFWIYLTFQLYLSQSSFGLLQVTRLLSANHSKSFCHFTLLPYSLVSFPPPSGQHCAEWGPVFCYTALLHTLVPPVNWTEGAHRVQVTSLPFFYTVTLTLLFSSSFAPHHPLPPFLVKDLHRKMHRQAKAALVSSPSVSILTPGSCH